MTRDFSLAIVIIALSSLAASAEFTVFSGDASQESAWQLAAGGNVPREDFEAFSGVGGPGTGGDVLTSLPSLHVLFDPVPPGVYDDAQWAHSGSKQWSNWAGGAGNSASHTLRPEPGRQIFALGFWNCDPQGGQPMEAYDDADQLVGTITGAVNTHNSDPQHSDGFAGFISTTPIAYVMIPGALGDGWNHVDDLQVVTELVSDPDYSHNFVVDAADYTVWRDTLNQTGPGLAADGSGPAGLPDQVVDQYDYEFWKSHFGEMIAAGNGSTGSGAAAVPESPSFALLLTGIILSTAIARAVSSPST